MQLLDTVLLFSLPASGKSEVRSFMSSLTEEECKRDFGMGPTVQLDDYPYVHLMRCVDAELTAMGREGVYFWGPDRPFRDLWSWAVLTELLNEDYARLHEQRPYDSAQPVYLLLDRFDAAHKKFGMSPVIGKLPYQVVRHLAAALQTEATRELALLNRTLSQGRQGCTVVLEAARGGPNGSAFPLTPPCGYATAFDVLSPTILERACVLYIWVDPAESRRKNIERGRPNAQGSILHHCVPMEVMLSQYGTDDMEYLMQRSDRPGSIRIDRIVEQNHGYATQAYYLRAARFDNRVDRTTFVRGSQAEWKPEDVRALHNGLSQTFAALRVGSAA